MFIGTSKDSQIITTRQQPKYRYTLLLFMRLLEEFDVWQIQLVRSKGPAGNPVGLGSN